jgi:hypothetical protein
LTWRIQLLSVTVLVDQTQLEEGARAVLEQAIIAAAAEAPFMDAVVVGIPYMEHAS